MSELKQQIEKEIHELEISPFTQYIALRNFEKNVLGLVADCVCIPRKPLQELLRVKRIAVLLDKHDKLGLTPDNAIHWFIETQLLGDEK